MKTETKEVKTFVTRLYCDCGEEMKPRAEFYPSKPSKIGYECPKCKEFVSNTEKYPKIEHSEVETVF